MKQILIGLILGVLFAWAAPEAAHYAGFFGTIFVTALKGVAPVLVFVLVMSSIANNSVANEAAQIKPIFVLYMISTFGAAAIAVVASFLWPTVISLATPDEGLAAPGGIGEVLTSLVLNIVDNPFRAMYNANYIGSSPGRSQWASSSAVPARLRAKCSKTPLKPCSSSCTS